MWADRDVLAGLKISVILLLSILLLWVLFIGETDTKSEFLHIKLKS